MRIVGRLAIVATLLFGCVGCDQVSKEYARSQYVLGESHSYLGDTFRIIHVENPGAFLGIGASLPESTRTIVFQGAISILILALLWAAAFRVGTPRWHMVGFTLLAASGIGNLIDRLLNDGRVTDFLNVGIGAFRTGIFNIADVVGVAGLLVFILANRESMHRTNACSESADRPP